MGACCRVCGWRRSVTPTVALPAREDTFVNFQSASAGRINANGLINAPLSI